MTKSEKSEYDRKWREKNAERIRGYKRKYYLENSEKCKLAVSNHRKEHPEYAKEYSSKHRNKLREYALKFLHDHPEKYRERTWKNQGIDMEHWSYSLYCDMFRSQHGKCLGCGCDLVMSKTKSVGKFSIAHVDHDHNTGRVRGLLCGHCNEACGKAKDNPNILRRLASYLEAHVLLNCDCGALK